MRKISYPKILLISFSVLWVVLAIAPKYRDIWFSENILTIILVLGLVWTYKKFKFSNWSYTALFIFLVLHSIGAYYSYSEMPLFELLKNNFELMRNHYDRLVHFLFGVVFYFPTYELVRKVGKVKGIWAHIMTFSMIVSAKGLYEILEWVYSVTWENTTAVTSFLGMQGDMWDAQKDMGVGTIGAILSGIVVWVKGKF